MVPGAGFNGTNGASHTAAIEAERAKGSLTFKEEVAPGLCCEVELRGILASVQSPFQKVEILDTYFGKVRCSGAGSPSSLRDEWPHVICVCPYRCSSPFLRHDRHW